LQAYVYDSVDQHRHLTKLLHGEVEEAVRAATEILQRFFGRAVTLSAAEGANWRQHLVDDFVVQVIVALARDQSPGEMRIALGAAAISGCKQLVSEPTLDGAYGLLDQARHKITNSFLRRVTNQTTAGIHEHLEMLWDEPRAASLEAADEMHDHGGPASHPSTSAGIDISEPPDGAEEESNEDHG
jgi:hypothetical protein